MTSSKVYGNHGYPDAAVDVKQQTTKNPERVVLDVAIKSGTLIDISAIEIHGNQRASPDGSQCGGECGGA